jgi:hypothetical protein
MPKQRKQPTPAKGAKAAMTLIGGIIPAISPGSLISAAVQRRPRPLVPKAKKRGRGRG